MIAVLADLHIKPRTWSNWTDIKEDAYYALSLAGTELQKNSTEYTILAGDVLDSNTPCSTDLLHLEQFMKSVKTVYYIPGNHDPIQPSFLALYDNTVQLGLQPVYIEGGAFFGVPYSAYTTKVLEDLASIKNTIDNDKIDVPVYIIMHESFKHLLGMDCSKISIDDVLSVLPPSVHIIVGDIHVNDLTCFKEDSGWVYSPGPLYPQDWEQAKRPGFLSWLDAANGKITPQELRVRHYIDLPVLDKGFKVFDDLRALLGTLKEMPLKPAVRLRIGEGLVLPPIPEDLKESCLFSTCSELEEVGSVLASEEGSSLCSMDQAVASVVESTVPEDLQPGVFQLYAVLAGSTDPKAVVQDWIKERKVVLA